MEHRISNAIVGYSAGCLRAIITLPTLYTNVMIPQLASEWKVSRPKSKTALVCMPRNVRLDIVSAGYCHVGPLASGWSYMAATCGLSP